MWTYGGEPQSEPIDAVRFLVGDTNDADELVQDEEIEWALENYPPKVGRPPWGAAAIIVDAILLKMARQIDKSIGDLSSSASQKYDHYLFLSKHLKALWATDGKGYYEDGSGIEDADIGGGLSVVPAIPRLGGGGPTVLGVAPVRSGGGGL